MKQRIVFGVSGRISSILYLLAVFVSSLYVSSVNIYAQAPKTNAGQTSYVKTNGPQTPGSTPFLKEYRKVTLGMSADELRDVWGEPDMEYSDGFLYEVSDSETVQIVIDPEKKITAISVTFVKGKGAPAFTTVFGENVTPEKSKNGSVYKMVRYEGAGYWVAYSAGPDDGASVSVTMQKF